MLSWAYYAPKDLCKASWKFICYPLPKACKNPFKNRYCNLYPFDTNLVKLGNDRFVNASWIDFAGSEARFIAAMGPMHPGSYSSKLQPDNDGVEDTIPDFWEMCWNTEARVIVMLCTIQPGNSSSAFFCES